MNVSLPHHARRVDPMEARYQKATAFERARDEDVTVDVGDAPGRATVTVGDGDPHDVVLVEDDDGEIGYCDCDGFAFHQDELAGGVCTHLVALAMEATLNGGLVKTVDGVMDVDDARDHPDTEQEGLAGEDPGAEPEVVDADSSERCDPAEAPTTKIDDPFAGALENVDDRFVMTLGGDPYIRREGWQRLARSEGYRLQRTMVTFQSETDSTLAECEAQVLDGDDVVAEATGTAHIDGEDMSDAVANLNELAETRAYSRALGWATGAGLSAVEVDASAEYEDERARP